MKDEGKLYIRTLTPVHIGDAKEKNKAKNIDFIEKDGFLYFLNESKITDHFGVDSYANALEKGNLYSLLRSVDPGEFSEKRYRITGEAGSDILTNVSDPITGNVYLPGSSLKGAIRSVLVNNEGMVNETYFNKKTRREESKLIEPFGKINEDAFRFLLVSDYLFESDTYINTKTFSVIKSNGNFYGGWKHQNNTNSEFDSSGFTFPFQCIAPGQISEGKLLFKSKLYNTQGNRIKKTRTIGLISDDFKNLFEIIQSYTDKYLSAEIGFFKQYSNQETDQIIGRLEYLKKQNEKAPVLRIGGGSGFHSITGNHQFPDQHTINGFGNRNRGQFNGKDSAKTRKLGFLRKTEKIEFEPLGFVQLIHPEYHKEFLKTTMNQLVEKQKIRAQQKEIEKVEIERQKELERIAAIEAMKPKMIEAQSLKKNAVKVDAEVVSWKFRKLVLRPFVEGFENTEYEVDYPSEVEPGTIMVIKMRLVGKKKDKLQHEGRPIEK